MTTHSIFEVQNKAGLKCGLLVASPDLPVMADALKFTTKSDIIVLRTLTSNYNSYYKKKDYFGNSWLINCIKCYIISKFCLWFKNS